MKTAVAKASFNCKPLSGIVKLVPDLLVEGKAVGKKQSESMTPFGIMSETGIHRSAISRIKEGM